MRLLTGGRRTSVPHHRTIRATLDWSYDLLTASEQIVFLRLAVFSGGFTFAAGAAVASDTAHPAEEIDRLIVDLVPRSLVIADTEAEEPRLRLLDTTRAYALERLAVVGERDVVARCHATYYADLSEGTPEPAAADDAIGPEIDNVREALAWAFRPRGDLAIGVRLAAASVPLWTSLSLLAEAHGWKQKAIASLDAAGLQGTRQEMVLQEALGFELRFAKSATAEAHDALRRANHDADHSGADGGCFLQDGGGWASARALARIEMAQVMNS